MFRWWSNLCYAGGVIPNIIIGDLDSIDKKVYEYFLEKGVKIVSYPKEKDFSDTELCIDYALNLGAKKYV
ncbi:hypothetical protein [Caloramator sp. mosi_1]|uniref:hypothetical protein n=1 Tax=Caloramator sp. mosi_1 TaxID=3023090 RepID=UPI003FCDB77A